MTGGTRIGFRLGPRISLSRGLFPAGKAGRSALLDTWRHVAGELGGRVELTARGAPHRLCVPHREWLVVVDIYVRSNGESSTVYTRVRSLFVRVGGSFRLTVAKRHLGHGLAGLFGVRPVPLGYDRLNRALWVRSDRADVARSLLRGSALGQSLLRTPFRLMVTRPERRIRRVTGESVGEVRLLRRGRVREVSTLRDMIQICQETLDGLVRFGVATEEAVVGAAI